MKLLKALLVVAIVLVVLFAGLLFSVENDVAVPLSLIVVELPEQRLSVWLMAAFAIGGVCGVLAAGFSNLRLRLSRTLVNRKLHRTEAELQRSRTPLPPA